MRQAGAADRRQRCRNRPKPCLSGNTARTTAQFAAASATTAIAIEIENRGIYTSRFSVPIGQRRGQSRRDKSLFLAFHVRDQFVDAQKADQTTPHQNDGVEVFIDGDRVPNDFSTTTQVNATQTKVFPSEGFEPLADAAGHQFTRAARFW